MQGQKNYYNIALVSFFIYNAAVFIGWGSISLLLPEAWAGQLIPNIDVYNMTAVARTEIRAMYGGLQIAVGLMALVAAFKAKHRESALLFLVLSISGLTLARLLGIIIEGSDSYILFATDFTPSEYNEVAVGMFELPNFIWAWLLVLLKKRV